MRYRFSKSKNKFLVLIKLLDKIGYSFFKHTNCELDLNNINSITIVQLGHLGDFLLTLPFLYELKYNFPNKRLSVAVLPENYELAGKFDFIDEVIKIRQSNFSRKYHGNYINTILDYKKIRTDLIFEVRGDLRILIFLKLFSNYKYLVGYKVGGLGFVLDNCLEYPFSTHISKTYYKFLEFATNKKFEIKRINLPYKVLNNIPNNYIVINVSSGAQSRNWDLKNFVRLAEKIVRDYKVNIVFVGVLNKNDFYFFCKELNISKYEKFFYNYVNKTSLLEVFYLIKKGKFFIGLESGLTHAATFFEKNIIALYSDTTNVNIWKPYKFNNEVCIIKKNVECGNCGKLNCINNKCMKLITVEEVYKKFREMYNKFLGNEI